MARVLFLTQVLPYPLNAGPKVRAYYMLRYLAEQHQVTLVSFIRPDDSREAIEHLEGICHRVYTVLMRRSLWRNIRAGVKGLLTGLPMVVARDEIGEMRATLRQVTQMDTYDIIHADQLSMAAYGRIAARNGAPRTLLDEHNAVYLLARRMADTETNALRRVIVHREAEAFARYEAAMCRAYDAVLTVTEEDKEHLLALYPPEQRSALAQKFTVVPICIEPRQVPLIERIPGSAPTIVHIGTMFWPPNVHGVLWFAREVLPLIHQQIPEARLVIIGKKPPPEVQSLATDPRIEVTGYVADLTPFLAQADVFIVPVHAGGGMRVKILDAWLWGIPIVSTTVGVEGIRVRTEENILIADQAETFAAAVTRLITDEELNRRLRRNGREWVEQHYHWRSVYRQVDRIYNRLMNTIPS
ncbi:MAG: glycosyltransferase [Chloroflexi bacterium]|nr:glycosyltransferase [Chloroflexota bacterium]